MQSNNDARPYSPTSPEQTHMGNTLSDHSAMSWRRDQSAYKDRNCQSHYCRWSRKVPRNSIQITLAHESQRTWDRHHFWRNPFPQESSRQTQYNHDRAANHWAIQHQRHPRPPGHTLPYDPLQLWSQDFSIDQQGQRSDSPPRQPNRNCSDKRDPDGAPSTGRDIPQ